VKLLFSTCFSLKSLDLWRAHSLTQNGFRSITGLTLDMEEEKLKLSNLDKQEAEEMKLLYDSCELTPSTMSSLGIVCCLDNLQELDIGWADPPPMFVKNFVKYCGKSLVKLFLTACRRK